MINGVSWSLTNELFFYMLFTLALLIPNKKYIFTLLLVYLIFLITLPTFSFIDFNYNASGFKQLLIFPMNIEFLLGILIVFFLERFPKKWCVAFLIIGVGCFILSSILSNNRLILFNNGYDRVLMFGFPSFLIILSLVKYELANNVIVNKLFLKLGDASYSIYLFHLPIVAAFFKIIVKLPVTNHLLLVLISLALFMFVCFAGIIIYKKIERPVIKWLNITLA